jgi:hypothetical protein
MALSKQIQRRRPDALSPLSKPLLATEPVLVAIPSRLLFYEYNLALHIFAVPHQRLRRLLARLPRGRNRFPEHRLAAVVTGLGIHDVRREDERQVRESLGEVPDQAV